MTHVLWMPHVNIYLIWIQPTPHLNYKPYQSIDYVNSSVDCVEIEFLAESEGQLGHPNHSPTDVFHEHHDYELFLLQKEIDG